jgi:exopolysaccharide biosynthesis protein
LHRRPLCILFALIVCLLSLPAAADTAASDSADLPPLPQEKYYLSDTQYQDPTISVQVYTGGRIYETDYMYAVIKISQPSQLRTAMAYRYNYHKAVPGLTIAKANRAVLAVNADYHTMYENGYLTRRGVNYRNRPDANWDVLIIDQNGDMHGIVEPEDWKITEWQQENSSLTIVDTFNFGPVLMQDGEWREVTRENMLNLYRIEGDKYASRMAICQLDTLTYMVVACESPEDENSRGMTLAEFTDCLREAESKLDGYRIRFAYNLDGGNSTTIIFHDQKINPTGTARGRDLSDIIYFVTAWQEE